MIDANRIWRRLGVEVGHSRIWCSVHMQGAEQKDLLDKSDMTGENNATRNGIIAAISFPSVGVAKKHARERAWCQFVGCCGGEVWVS
jgi:hypothetical protein